MGEEPTAVVTPEELRLITCVEMNEDCDKEILAKRVGIAINMVLKGLISVGKGAELAGMNYIEFVNEFRKRGLKPFTASEEDLTLLEKLGL